MGAIARVIAAQRTRQERDLVEHLRDQKALSSASAAALRPQQPGGLFVRAPFKKLRPTSLLAGRTRLRRDALATPAFGDLYRPV